MYEYEALITGVYDGDTCTATIDLGFRIFRRGIKLRLADIDTPEIRTRDPEEKLAGYVARDFLRERVLNKQVRVRSVAKGKYGRYLCTIWVLDENGTPLGASVNEELIERGLAKVYGT